MPKEKLTRVTLKPGNKTRQGKTDYARLKKLSDAQIKAAARKDKDNLPLTKKQLAKFKRVNPIQNLDVQKIRNELGLSQQRFASYFGVSVRTLQDWEQHRHEPSRTAKNFLLVVAKAPQAVQKALSGIF